MNKKAIKYTYYYNSEYGEYYRVYPNKKDFDWRTKDNPFGRMGWIRSDDDWKCWKHVCDPVKIDKKEVFLACL